MSYEQTKVENRTVFIAGMNEVIRKWKDKKEFSPHEEYILSHLAHNCSICDLGRSGVHLHLTRYGVSDTFSDVDSAESSTFSSQSERDFELLYKRALVSALDNLIFMAEITKRDIQDLLNSKSDPPARIEEYENSK